MATSRRSELKMSTTTTEVQEEKKAPAGVIIPPREIRGMFPLQEY
jgi:hypothetical protein